LSSLRGGLDPLRPLCRKCGGTV